MHACIYTYRSLCLSLYICLFLSSIDLLFSPSISYTHLSIYVNSYLTCAVFLVSF